VRSDPFEEFVKRQCSYGYLAVGLEHPRMLRGLYEAISEFMGRSSQRLQSWFRRRFLDKDGVYNGDFFYNNFEMSVLPRRFAALHLKSHARHRLRVADWTSDLHQRLFQELQVLDNCHHFDHSCDAAAHRNACSSLATVFSSTGGLQAKLSYVSVASFLVFRWGDGPVRSVTAGFTLQVRKLLFRAAPMFSVPHSHNTCAGVSIVSNAECSLLASESGSDVGVCVMHYPRVCIMNSER
jgi:hypothetical protein